MKKTVLSYLVAAVVYTLNIAAAFITAINCGREGYDNRTAWIIFFILLLIVGLYLVRAGSAQRFFWANTGNNFDHRNLLDSDLRPTLLSSKLFRKKRECNRVHFRGGTPKHKPNTICDVFDI